jgi:hypothetical protein
MDVDPTFPSCFNRAKPTARLELLFNSIDRSSNSGSAKLLNTSIIDDGFRIHSISLGV